MIVLTQGKAPRPTAVALGLFDGVHLGHRAVLHAAAAHKAEGLLPAVFTFSAPSISYKQHRQVQFLYTDAQKQQLLAAQGMELIYSPLFPEIAPLTGEDFSARILRDLLRAQVVVCGEDFRFGKKCRLGHRGADPPGTVPRLPGGVHPAGAVGGGTGLLPADPAASG